MALLASSVSSIILLFLVVINCFSALDALIAPDEVHKQRSVFGKGEATSHIVYLGDVSNCRGGASVCSKLLAVAIGGLTGTEERLLYTYNQGFCGCVVKVTDSEADVLSKFNGVVSVFKDQKLDLLTTRSWDFMGMGLDVARNKAVESDIIVGMIDTGIWPESASFDDTGLGPPPKKWKGTCDPNIKCNNKIIGARVFQTVIPDPTDSTPRDNFGHGTHTASTVAGALVGDASLFGLAKGTARGGVPSARIAVYKACSLSGCFSSDILAAFDAAIADGVDMLSVSLGSDFASSYFIDPVAIGSFHAMEHGILTSAAAGNSGPDPGTVTNVAPWLMSVAASTIDRSFTTWFEYGKGKRIKGISINADNSGLRDLIYGSDAKNESSIDDPRGCTIGSLDPVKVKGKIVLCEGRSPGGAFLAGAAGAILLYNNFLDVPRVPPFPASQTDTETGKRVLQYYAANETDNRSKRASIRRSTVTIGTKGIAPYVISFSSRGPNLISGGILKPDIAAPGVAILAAWSGNTSPSLYVADPRRSPFTIISGTSMACPHATAAAAYVKSFNPSFSPAAIQSALMTTASRLDVLPDPLAEFSYGAGHIDPVQAKNPGLVYDATINDYASDFLCQQQGIVESVLKLIMGDPTFSCTKVNSDLNYPSITFKSSTKGFFQRTVRTVTNVAGPSTYTVSVTEPSSKSMTIIVSPNVLTFTTLGEKQSFTITVSGTIGDNDKLVSGALEWDDGEHKVRSPVVVYTGM